MRPELRRTQRHRWLIAAVVIPGMLAFTAACGSDGERDSGTSSNSGAAAFEEYQLEFAKCMRDQGIDFPDPETGKGGMGTTLEIEDQDAFDNADGTCKDELGEPPANPEAPDLDPADQKEMYAKFDKCLRDNGIDVPKSTPEGARPAFPSDIDPKIMEKCSKLSEEGLG